MTHLPLPAVDDEAGARIPEGLPPVVDAHVHVFPDLLFDAVWDWFDRFGWPVRYRYHTDRLVDFLLQRGVRHIVALQYAHKPGIAEDLNRYMTTLCSQHSALTGLATVYPGEPGTRAILEAGFRSGLKGVKLHSHVQCFDMDSPGMHEVYRACCDVDVPLVIHAGREPKSPAYACDPHELCHWTFVERVLRAYPGLKLVVPHLGADEFEAYQRLVEQFDNLWLDTTMVLADYLPIDSLPRLDRLRPDRLMFGTDFPNIPYAWDRELRRLAAMALEGDLLRRLLAGNAAALFKIDLGADDAGNHAARKDSQG